MGIRDLRARVTWTVAEKGVWARRRCIVGAVRRVVVGVDGSLGSLQALRYAADEARERCVPLVAVIAWVPPGGDAAERSRPSPYLRRVWREEARKRPQGGVGARGGGGASGGRGPMTGEDTAEHPSP